MTPDAGLAAAVARGLALDPRQTVSAWADRYRILAGRATAEPGRWRTARTPYLQAIMDALGATSPVQRVVVMKSARVGGTEAAVNWLGYVIHQAPGPFLFVQPTVDLAKRLARQTLEPAIAETPVLTERIAPGRTRAGTNTTLLKQFPGGLVMLTGANSAAGLRSLTARYLCFDEVDAYPLDVRTEGDPLALAEARGRTFGRRRKVLIVSTPTVAGMSRIEREYQATDQRRFFVPCPHCQTMQPLEFPRLRWTPGQPETAHYVCVACEWPIPEGAKPELLAAGEWRPTAVGTDPATIGFHVNALYSPLGWLSWAEIARAADQAASDPVLQKTFTNTVLGEVYAEPTDAPDWRRLVERQTADLLGTVPAGVVFLTAGVDVQGNRLEASVWGWGRGRRRWLVDHQVLDGDVLADDCWNALTVLVERSWPTVDGRRRARLAYVAIDGGYLPQRGRDWLRQPGRTVRAELMRGGPPSRMLVSTPKQTEPTTVTGRTRRRHKGVGMREIDVAAAKAELYAALRLEGAGAGAATPPSWVSLPTVGEEFCRQLTAEGLVRRRRHGRERLEWVKLYQRNEALDCANLARAAAHLVGLDRLRDEEWLVLEAHFTTDVEEAAAGPAAGPQPTGPRPSPAPGAAAARSPIRWRSSDFWGGRRR